MTVHMGLKLIKNLNLRNELAKNERTGNIP